MLTILDNYVETNPEKTGEHNLNSPSNDYPNAEASPQQIPQVQIALSAMIKYITFFEDIASRYTSIVTAFERIGTLQDELHASSKAGKHYEYLKKYIVMSKRAVEIEKNLINDQIKLDISYILEKISQIICSIEYETFAK